MTAGRRLLFAVAAVLVAGAAQAGQRALPVPARVIYPGDRITGAMLVDSRDFSAEPGDVVWDRADLVGKVARRTLLPGRPIAAIAVGAPRAVSMGALVSVYYQQDGIDIATTAQALQNGYVGQVVQARNLDSGVVISGVVQADGSIRVRGG
ncbi:flagellar basal body P-ring formation chaperone FlgA [Rhodoblastus acidophilus]|uniref:Flagella basal body P-ring formation protein FlgA n=1 Tax=Candidatus Rhodoblastus alkanivorans TaxID=2954117 RepID=A0ABS9Z3H4_9HYPH|nr:flagellar basal body P-ring formation chaperone FlgA [Candidatus Rhodoblastus alkanivorans]MCI4678824.1 flagellar basal body P-ring formation chaperone FlgA [Candidatus Rhodoblastus alkanivorans]MCI4682213.1 flagellar basal body P-ring formation chaperone FlgA [Candidatus Rhodoblastus alkanivorans]MDI4639515.1 flagellar basal body P-ring formation chaperone FlgA [Rhodoblastus acidophilus]